MPGAGVVQPIGQVFLEMLGIPIEIVRDRVHRRLVRSGVLAQCGNHEGRSVAVRRDLQAPLVMRDHHLLVACIPLDIVQQPVGGDAICIQRERALEQRFGPLRVAVKQKRGTYVGGMFGLDDISPLRGVGRFVGLAKRVEGIGIKAPRRDMLRRLVQKRSYVGECGREFPATAQFLGVGKIVRRHSGIMVSAKEGLRRLLDAPFAFLARRTRRRQGLRIRAAIQVQDRGCRISHARGQAEAGRRLAAVHGA